MFLIFGCAPKNGVSQLSTMAKSVCAAFDEYITENGGALILEKALEDFKLERENLSQLNNSAT